MKPYFHRTPGLVKWLYPNWIWDFRTSKKEIAITFDDGPNPEVTPFILDELKKYGAKATFFCVGTNIKKYPNLVRKILEAGHEIGNHTFHHLNGGTTDFDSYIQDVAACQELLLSIQQKHENKLFRPPYGKLTFKQSKALQSAYHIVMWDTLSGDFDPTLSAQKCLQKTTAHIHSGSIVLFHDNQTSTDKILAVLPDYLKILYQKGFCSVSLTEKLLFRKPEV